MKYKNDLYISFPDKGDTKANYSWINNFKGFIEILLVKLLKRKITIVLGNEKLAKEALKSSTTYILMFNENFKTKEFQNEIKEIIQTAKENFNDRVFKIFTSKIDYNDYTEFLNPLFNYNFYTIDADSGNILEFSDLKGEKDEKLFWLKLVDLTYDIYKSIIKLENKVEQNSSDRHKTIFLAETEDDQLENRDIIKRELLQHGYTVLPQKKITHFTKNFETEVRQSLEQSNMSIHIIGEGYSQNSDEDHSICAKQNSIASTYYTELEKSNNTEKLKRVIWISPELNLKTEKQKNQIEQFKQNEEYLHGAEVVQTPIELLKTLIHNRLSKNEGIEKTISKNTEQKDSSKDLLSVYLIYDNTENKSLKSVEDYFAKHNFNIFHSSFDGNEYELIKQHKKKLVEANMVFILNNYNNEWLISKIKDILKSPGFGRTEPFLSQVIYYTEDQKIQVDEFTKENFLILKGKVEFDPKILDPLFKKQK